MVSYEFLGPFYLTTFPVPRYLIGYQRYEENGISMGHTQVGRTREKVARARSQARNWNC